MYHKKILFVGWKYPRNIYFNLEHKIAGEHVYKIESNLRSTYERLSVCLRDQHQYLLEWADKLSAKKHISASHLLGPHLADVFAQHKLTKVTGF